MDYTALVKRSVKGLISILFRPPQSSFSFPGPSISPQLKIAVFQFLNTSKSILNNSLLNSRIYSLILTACFTLIIVHISLS